MIVDSFALTFRMDFQTKHGIMAIRIVLFLVLLFLFLAPASAHASVADGLEAIVGNAIEKYRTVSDYTCLFDKTELVDGALRAERNIVMKYRKPEMVYMKWTEGDNRGVEAIFAKGRYDNKMVVHLGGSLSFIEARVDPRSSKAMKDNRHPITEAGVGFVLNLIKDNYDKAKEDPESSMTIEGETRLGGRRVTMVKAVLPRGKGYYANVILLYFDKEMSLPLKVAVYGWNGEMLEQYRFRDLRINVGLTERDFDKDNPAYNF